MGWGIKGFLQLQQLRILYFCAWHSWYWQQFCQISNIHYSGVQVCSKQEFSNPIAFKKNSAKSSALGDVLQSNSTGHPVDSRRRPIEILLDIQQKFLLHFSIKLAILRHLKQTYKILVDVQQNLVDVQQEFYRTSSRPDDLGHCYCLKI